MKSLLLAHAVVWTLFSAVVVSADDDTDLDRLQGSWAITAMVHDGKSLPLPEGKKVVLTFFKDGKVISEGGQKGKLEGTFKLDSTRKPKTIDITNDQESTTAIYALNDSTLTLAMTTPTRKDLDDKIVPPRPVAFEGEKVLTITLTRQKPK